MSVPEAHLDETTHGLGRLAIFGKNLRFMPRVRNACEVVPCLVDKRRVPSRGSIGKRRSPAASRWRLSVAQDSEEQYM